MNLMQLKCFLAAMQTSSFSEAAELLYTSQSAVSKQIMSLEAELSVPLFDRSHRRAVPTEHARVLLPYAQTMLDDYAALLAAASGSEGVLRIAAIPVMAQYGITTLMADFRRLHPEIQLNLTEQEGGNIPSLLEKHACDLAVLRLLPQTAPRFKTLALATDRLIAVLPARHPLAGNARVSLRELASESFLLLDAGTLVYDLCLNACKELGFTPAVTYTGTRAENILELVAQGMGISLLMEKAVNYLDTPGVIALPLCEPIESTVVLAALRGPSLSPAARAFWEFAVSRHRVMNIERIIAQDIPL